MGASAAAGVAGAVALTDPALSAAQAVGVKPGDLPDLTIKEVKVYVTDITGVRRLNEENGEIASVVTNSGIEGNATLRPRMFHPNWTNLGWLDNAKRTLVGKNVMNFAQITSQWSNRGQGQSSYAVVHDTCMWDILGKAVGLPIYKILGAYKDKQMAYASSAHLRTVEEYGPDVLKAKAEGFKAYKIHPGSGQMASGPAIPAWKGHIEEIKLVRKTAGDDMILLFDPVQRYSRDEAMKVGRALQEYDFIAFEDPIPTTDITGLVDLARALDIPVEVGEFIFSIYDFPEYFLRGALDIARLICDNLGGITGAMKVGRMAECFGINCTPHNWGEQMDLACHFHVELALPNAPWFEMPFPQSGPDRPYHKDRLRIDKDGYVPAPKAPGLGYPLDRDALDKITKRIDR